MTLNVDNETKGGHENVIHILFMNFSLSEAFVVLSEALNLNSLTCVNTEGKYVISRGYCLASS